MGWADCGTDSMGRRIGYAFEATCDHPGCTNIINRGIDHACGGMHGADEQSCEGYFCHNHMWRCGADEHGRIRWVCAACRRRAMMPRRDHLGRFIKKQEV